MQVYVNPARRTFLRFQEGRKYNYYVTNVEGSVKVIKMEKEKDTLVLLNEPTATPEHFAETWSKSKQELSDRAKAVLTAALNGFEYKMTAPETLPAGSPMEPGEVVESPVVKKKQKDANPDEEEPKKPAVKKVINNADAVPLKEVCRRAGVEPRAARAILRKELGKADGRWEWPEKEVDKIVRVLQEAKSPC
mgnify:FL=1